MEERNCLTIPFFLQSAEKLSDPNPSLLRINKFYNLCCPFTSAERRILYNTNPQ